eukprot:5887151-Amphidinium_carterae.1
MWCSSTKGWASRLGKSLKLTGGDFAPGSDTNNATFAFLTLCTFGNFAHFSAVDRRAEQSMC